MKSAQGYALVNPLQRMAVCIGVAVFLLHAGYRGEWGWNQSARLGAIFSFVEPGTEFSRTFQINPYVDKGHPRGLWTWDWASHEGNYYSNKAPGASLLGVPPYFFLFHAERALGFDPTEREWTARNGYLINLFVSVFWTSLAAALLFLFLSRKGYRPLDALLVAFVYAFATLIFPFDTSLWGHTTTAAFLLLGAIFVERKEFSLTATSGFFTGLAVLTDYLAGLSLGLILLFLFLEKSGAKRILSFFLAWPFRYFCCSFIKSSASADFS